MNYPHNPPGLRWHEHYDMADAVFYAFVSVRSSTATQSAPDPLPEADRTTRPHVKGNGRRSYKSIYVGVTTHNRHYVAPGCGGSARPFTPEGERAAAIDRAVAMERDYLERRDGTQEKI